MTVRGMKRAVEMAAKAGGKALKVMTESPESARRDWLPQMGPRASEIRRR